MTEGAAELRPGQMQDGFVLEAVVPLPELRATAHRARHARSGARLIHLQAADSENLFSITLPTVPWDDSGAAHILEHSVLGGSRRYPVREPFFEMLKMSMGTFINAMTGPDYTTYPVASTVRADLFNLAEVYFDAVFHPLLTEETFLREGHRLTPADPQQPTGALAETGIVFNEMKGYYSRPEVVLSHAAQAALLPDTIYARESGGSPEAIPQLTHAGLRQFYRTYYHPSEAFFFTYGDIPLREHLAFLGERLQEFTRRPADAAVGRQPRWSAPRQALREYQSDPDQPLTAKTYLLLQWLAADATDPEEDMAFEVLDWILDGNEAAPLRKALVDAHLGQAPHHTGYRAVGAEGIYQVGLKGSEPDRAEAFLALVQEALRKVADGEIPRARVLAAFHQAAYGHLEIQTLFPLHLMDRVVGAWRLGADPLTFASLRPHLEACRGRYERDPLLFNRLIRERLLENPHRLLTVLAPSRDWEERRAAVERQRLQAVRARMDQEEVLHLAARSSEVERDSGTPNPPEAVALLPQLRVGDVPRRPRHIPTSVEPVAPGAELLRNDVFTNGVNYLILDLAAEALEPERWAMVPRYLESVHKLGAAGMDYERVAGRVAAATGGIGAGPVLGHTVGSEARGLRRLRYTVKALDDQIEDALAVLGDVIFATDPRDPARLQVVLEQSLAGMRTGLVNGAAQTAARHAARALSGAGYLAELLGGVSQWRQLDRLCRDFAAGQDEVMAEIARIRDALPTSGQIVASFTGSDVACDAVRRALRRWVAPLPGRRAPAVDPHPQGAADRTGLCAPLQVAYTAQVLPAPRYHHPDSPLLAVGTHLLTFAYIWPEIRFKGTAYGGTCAYDAVDGDIALLSWQDPHISRSLGVFGAVPEQVAAAPWTQSDVDRAIIATLKDGERPIRPAEATAMALQRHVAGLLPEMREARHQAILGATVAEVRRALLEAFASGLPRSGVCVVAGRQMLEQANRELRDAPLALADLFPAG